MFKKLLNVGKGHSSSEKTQHQQQQQQQQKNLFQLNEIRSYGFTHLHCLGYSPTLSLLAVGSKTGLLRVLGNPPVEFSYQLEPGNSIRQIEFIHCRDQSTTPSNNTKSKQQDGQLQQDQSCKGTAAKLVVLTDNGRLHLFELKNEKQVNFTDNTTQTDTLSNGTDCCRSTQQQQQQQQQQNVTKRRLVDRVCPPKTNEIAPEIKSYQDMLDFERKLDFNISRKTLDIQESLKRPARIKKTLKVSITNLFYRQQETGAPAWEVRIEGGLTDEKMPKRKFSSFFKSLVIELDSAIYGPDNHLVEWHRTATTSETDGFQVRRAGDLPVKCTILLQLNNTPPHFKINEKLARLVGKQTDTRQSVIFALWQYIKNNALQDPQDREYINNDDYLRSTFECKRMKFSEIPSKLDRLLSAPDPIVINHSIIRGNGESQRATFHFEVEIEDNFDARILNHDTHEIRQLDEKVFGLVADIKRSITNYEFFSDFSKDPQRSINKWLASQSSDLKIMTDQIGDAEEERKADYYYQPWMQEAVCRYFYRKVQERRNELEMALTSMRR